MSLQCPSVSSGAWHGRWSCWTLSGSQGAGKGTAFHPYGSLSESWDFLVWKRLSCNLQTRKEKEIIWKESTHSKLQQQTLNRKKGKRHAETSSQLWLGSSAGPGFSVRVLLSSLHAAELEEYVLHFADGTLRLKGTSQLRVQHLPGKHSTSWISSLQHTEQNGHCEVLKTCASYPCLSSRLLWILATQHNRGISQYQPNLQRNSKDVQGNLSLLCLPHGDVKSEIISEIYFYFLPWVNEWHTKNTIILSK